LVSDALFLWETLYEFVRPTCRFCASFFQLGMALLETCLSLAAGGRGQCADAAEAIIVLLVEVMRAFSEADFAAACVTAHELVRPGLERIEASSLTCSIRERLAGPLRDLGDVCSQTSGSGIVPLALFEAPRPQIRVLDPVFHEVGATRSSLRGMELTETKQLKRRLTKERRAAMRQLSRDATVLQQLQSRKDSELRVARKHERKRVSSLMAEEADMLKKLGTENTTSMDTSLRRYSAGKEKKQANPRMGGNTTADNKKERRGRKGAQVAGDAQGAPQSEQGGAGKRKKKVSNKGGG